MPRCEEHVEVTAFAPPRAGRAQPEGAASSAAATPVHAAEPIEGEVEQAPDAAVRARLRRAVPALSAIPAGALLLWLIAGVGFVNYDTLYGLVWGQQLARGETPEYGLPIAPTPHPLVELIGIPLAPLGASATTAIMPWRSRSSRCRRAGGCSIASAAPGSGAPRARWRRWSC